MLRIFKTGDEYRWVAVSSSAFEDRTGETVSTKAVDYSLEVTNGDYGELRLYHLPGSKVGTCDGSMRVGMFLVETGIFDNTDAAVSVRSTVNENPDKYGISIGFRYRPEDLIDNQYKRIKIFERSIVEEPDAAALFTNIRISEVSMEKEKELLVEKLTGMLGGNAELAADVYTKAMDIGIKMQVGEEIGFKEKDEDEDVEDAETEVVEDSTEEPEPEDESEDVGDEEESEPEDEEEVGKTQDFVLELDLPTIQSLAEEITKRMPNPEQETVKSINTQLKSLKDGLDSLGKIVNHLLKSDEDRLQEMQKQLPRVKLGYRASSEPETETTPPEEVVTKQHSAPVVDQSLADSLNAIESYRRDNLRIVS